MPSARGSDSGFPFALPFVCDRCVERFILKSRSEGAYCKETVEGSSLQFFTIPLPPRSRHLHLETTGCLIHDETMRRAVGLPPLE